MKRVIAILLAIIMMVSNIKAVDFKTNNSNEKLKVTRIDDKFVIELPSYNDNSGYRMFSNEDSNGLNNQVSVTNVNPKDNPEYFEDEWVTVDLAKILIKHSNIKEVKLTVEAHRGIKYEESYIIKTDESSTADPTNKIYKNGEAFSIPLPVRKYGAKMYLYMPNPDNRRMDYVVEAHIVPRGYELNVGFRAHTGVQIKWSGKKDRPNNIQAKYTCVNPSGYSFDIPIVDKNYILRQGESWLWKDVKNVEYKNLVPDGDIEINDEKIAGGVSVKVNNKTSGKLGNSEYYYDIKGDGYSGFAITMREKDTVDFDAGDGSWKTAKPAQQFAAYGLKLSETFMDAPDTIGPVTVPNGDNDLTPPAEEGKPDKKFAGWSTTKNGQKVEISDYVVTGNVTFYALYEEEKQGKVAIQYVDGSGTAIKDKYKIANQSYPAEATGNVDEEVDASKIPEPKFIGYERNGEIVVTGKKYLENGGHTVEVPYKKLDSIIPEKKNGKDNPDVTPEVKATYIPVTIKVDSEKGKFQKNDNDVTGSEFIYYVNPVEGKKFDDVLTASGLTAKSNDENANKIDAQNPWKFDPEKVKANKQEEVPSVVVKKDIEINKLHFTVEKGLVAEVNFGQTTADKFKDKLAPETIKVWVGDDIDWKKGVKVKDNAENKEQLVTDLETELAKANAKVEDLGENGTIAKPKTARTSENQNLPDGKKGNLKVTFDDGSTLVVNGQTLYVADHKVPIKEGDETNKINPKNLPDDKVAVKFLLGEGVQIGDDDATAIKGKKDNPVLYTTYYVKPDTSLEAKDIFVTKAQKEYKDNKWYNGDAELKAEDYTNIKKEKTFIAKAVKLGTGKVLIKYYLDGVKTEDIAEFKIDNENYPTEVTGKENTDVKASDIKQPELLGYEKAKNNPVEIPANAKYLTTNPVEVKLNYTKIDDIIGPNKPSDEKPAGYVTVTFKTADANKGKLWLKTDSQTEAPDEDSKLFTELVYYVNPKANEINLQNNKLSAKKADKTDKNVVVNAKPVSSKFEVLLKEGNYDWKLSVENAIVKDEEAQVNRVTKDLTLTVQYDGLYDREYKYVAVGTTKPLPTEIAQPNDKKKYPTTPEKLSKIPQTLDTPAMHMLVIKEGTENKAIWFFDKWKREDNSTKQLVTFTGKWKYFEPKGNETTVEQGGKPDPKDNISNNGDAPKDTKYEYDNDHKPDPNKIGEQEVVVVVEVPGPNDGETTKIKVKTKVKIVEKRKDYGYFYEPSPDYLNTGAPAKKEEKVQEKYLEAYRWYVKGNDMGMFMPKKGITRAEVAQMFARALEYDKAMVNVNITPYTDVDANAWYYEAVQKTSAAGIFKGSDKGTFMPTREITKAELIATIARFQHLSTKAGNTLNLQANHWATAEVEAAYQEGWLDIYTNGTAQFAADEVISREEVVTILNRAFGRIADTKYIDDNAHTMTNFPDATKDMWSYYEIMTAANTYLVDKMWVNHATKDNGPETLKEMIEWVKPLIDNKDVREVVEQVKFQR